MTVIRPASFALSAALIGLAAPALAQDALCNGLGANGQWIGGSEGGSDIATTDAYREQMALVLGGNQYVSLFSLSEPTSVRLEAAGRGAGDPLIDVIGPDGNIVVSDDDSGGNGAARAEVDLDPGTYCLALTSFDGAPMTAFVRIGRPEQEPLTEGIAQTASASEVQNATGGGSCDEAALLGTLAGGPISGTGSPEEAPFWSFSLENPTAVSITAANEDADPVMTLYDGNGEYLDENDDFDGLNSRLNMQDPLPAGEYCIEVSALNDTTLPVTVEVSEYDPEAVLAGQYLRGETAPPMDGSVDITDLGTLENRLRKDAQIGVDATWFSLDVPQGGLILIEAIAGTENGDPWVAVFDDLGRQIAMNDDHADTLDALVTARINAGTYLIAVKQVGSSSDGLVRMLFQRYIPAP